MRNLMLGMVVLIGGALTLAFGCGDDESADGSGAAAGQGGSTSGKGGSQASGGDTADAGDGNSSTGGDPGTGGSPEGGMPGAGGSEGGAGGAGFMNPEGCPEAAPAMGEACAVDLELQSACEYAGSSCVCNGFLGGGGAGGAMAGTWICRGAGADCPAEAPVTDDTCNDNGMHCPYPGGVDCFCAGNDWDCVALDPGPGQGGAGGGGPAPIGDCPDLEPGDTDECVGPIPNCLYPESGTLCHCPSNGASANEWSCQ